MFYSQNILDVLSSAGIRHCGWQLHSVAWKGRPVGAPAFQGWRKDCVETSSGGTWVQLGALEANSSQNNCAANLGPSLGSRSLYSLYKRMGSCLLASPQCSRELRPMESPLLFSRRAGRQPQHRLKA